MAKWHDDAVTQSNGEKTMWMTDSRIAPKTGFDYDWIYETF